MSDSRVDRAPWYVTTAIAYVNARPHLGFAMELILADALARYRRLCGRDVRFQTGTDENSLKNVLAAAAEGLATADLVARNAECFRDLREPLGVSFDHFIRTSADPRHAPGVARLWRAVDAAGDLYKRSYEGLYCVGCEQFLTAGELDDGRCPEHRVAPEPVAEENYFFALSRYRDELLALIESGRLRIRPEPYRREVLAFLRGGLEDISVSRSRTRARGWGVPVPGDPEQVMYVWFDALGNYITALDYADDGPLYRRFWAECPSRVHVIGKGILRFHAIYWPAMLLSAGEPPPTDIEVHGYVTVDGDKIGKSAGNAGEAMEPTALAARCGADALRYFLLRHVKTGQDGDFRLDRLLAARDGELAGGLGNLLNRVVAMIAKYRGGQIPAGAAPQGESDADTGLERAAREAAADAERALDEAACDRALDAAWRLVDAANKYVDETAPWRLASAARDRASGAGDAGSGAGDARAARRLDEVLANLAESLRIIGALVAPAMPQTAAQLRAQLGLSEQPALPWRDAIRWDRFPAGRAVAPGALLFPPVCED